MQPQSKIIHGNIMFITTMDMVPMLRILSRHINRKSNIQIYTFTQLGLVTIMTVSMVVMVLEVFMDLVMYSQLERANNKRTPVWPTLNTSMDLPVGHAVKQLATVLIPTVKRMENWHIVKASSFIATLQRSANMDG